jgi:radical SAM-linked protein
MRIRFRFTKLGKVRFTGQRDVARMWERALRRASMPLAYTEGFSPRPQLSFGLALPTGCESLAEYVDVVLDDARPETAGIEVEALPALFTGLLPPGLEVEEAGLFERRDGSLQQQVTSCSWTMWFAGTSAAELERQVATFLAAESVPIARERKGRRELDDLRPSVLGLTVTGEASPPGGGPPVVSMTAELAAEAGGEAEGPVLDRACRTQQWIERDGRRLEPLGRSEGAGGAGRATYALERAS